MWGSQEWDECVVQETGKIRVAKLWCDTGPHFRCYELAHYLHSVAAPRFDIELHFHAEHHGKCLADSWFSLVSRALKCHSLRPNSTQLSIADLQEALLTVLGEFRENKRMRTDEEPTWNYTIKEYERDTNEPRHSINPKVAFISSVYYISFPATKERILYRLPGEAEDREVTLREAKEQRPSASLQGFPNLVPSAVRSIDSSVRNPLSSHAGRMQRVENIRSGQHKRASGVPRRTYACRKCGQPKKGHTCTAVAASPEPQQVETNEARRLSNPAPSAQLPPLPAAVVPRHTSRVCSHAQSLSASETAPRGLGTHTNTNHQTTSVTPQGAQHQRAPARPQRAVALSVHTGKRDYIQAAPEKNRGLLSEVASVLCSFMRSSPEEENNCAIEKAGRSMEQRARREAAVV